MERSGKLKQASQSQGPKRNGCWVLYLLDISMFFKTYLLRFSVRVDICFIAIEAWSLLFWAVARFWELFKEKDVHYVVEHGFRGHCGVYLEHTQSWGFPKCLETKKDVCWKDEKRGPSTLWLNQILLFYMEHRLIVVSTICSCGVVEC